MQYIPTSFIVPNNCSRVACGKLYANLWVFIGFVPCSTYSRYMYTVILFINILIEWAWFEPDSMVFLFTLYLFNVRDYGCDVFNLHLYTSLVPFEWNNVPCHLFWCCLLLYIRYRCIIKSPIVREKNSCSFFFSAWATIFCSRAKRTSVHRNVVFALIQKNVYQ